MNANYQIHLMQNVDFNLMIAEHTTNLKSFAYKFTKDSGVADDLYQDTMVKAVRYFGQFKPGTNIKAWLFTIMRNTFINDYRRDIRKNALIIQEDEISSAHLLNSSTSNGAEGSFAMADIQKALSTLEPKYRILFVKYFEGFKYEEIAQEMNIPIGTVKTRIHLARQVLQKQLKAYRR